MKHAAVFPVAFLLIVVPCSGVQSQSLRIATFNVNYDNLATDEIVEAITSSNADVLCIQESTKRSLAILRQRLSDVYPHRTTVGEFSFASRSELQDLQFYESGRGCYSALVTIGRRRMRIVNVHLSPPSVHENPNIVGLLQALKISDERNRNEMAAILEHIDASIPTVIAGDFNSLSVSKAPSLLRALGFIDSYATIHQDADSNSTWDWQSMQKLEPRYVKKDLPFAEFAGNLPFGLRVDFIFHTDHFRTLSSEIIPGGGSDHYLVVSELKIDEQTHPREPASGPSLGGESSSPAQ